MNATGVSLPPNGFVNSMKSWTLQMGYPTIYMKRNGTNDVKITQERFLLDPLANKSEPESPYK